MTANVVAYDNRNPFPPGAGGPKPNTRAQARSRPPERSPRRDLSSPLPAPGSHRCSGPLCLGVASAFHLMPVCSHGLLLIRLPLSYKDNSHTEFKAIPIQHDLISPHSDCNVPNFLIRSHSEARGLQSIFFRGEGSRIESKPSPFSITKYLLNDPVKILQSQRRVFFLQVHM